MATALCAPWPAGADLPTHVHVLAHNQSALWRIDTASGDRELVELSAYPLVMTVYQAVQTPGGEVVFTASNAAMKYGVLAYNPATGGRSGVSGPVEGDGSVVRGSGPAFEPSISGLAMAPWGALWVLRTFQGPMHVSPVTGDRTVTSQPANPRVGSGYPITRPIDVAVETTGSLLVMDQYEGLVRVRLADGLRTMVYPNTSFIEPPIRFDLLRDGRIVHVLPGTDAVFVFDPRTATDAPLSGRGRGGGSEMGALSDVAVAPDGTVIVVTVAESAVLAVDPVTGDRTLVSGAGRGDGPELPTGFDAPTLAGFAAESVPPDLESRRVRRHLHGRGD